MFNGSDLGKEFSANPLNARFHPPQPQTTEQPQPTAQQLLVTAPNETSGIDLLDILLQPDLEDTGALNKIKRESKKKRKGLNL